MTRVAIGLVSAALLWCPAGGASATYPMTLDSWVQVARLAASGAGAQPYLGRSLAVSADGSTVVAGAPANGAADPGAGAVYVYQKGSSGWGNGAATVRLTASDAVSGDAFGSSIAISGDGATVAVGAPDAQVGSHGSQGAIYVFVRPASGWVSVTETAKLVASDGAADDHLGATMAISGDGSDVMAAAQLPKGAASGSVVTAGEVYVFERSASGWVGTAEKARLVASDGNPGDGFGGAIAVSEDGSTAAVGAPGKTLAGVRFEGAVYVFAKPSSGWASRSETAILTLPTPSDIHFNDSFGASVAVSGDGSAVVAGAPSRNGYRGAACLFATPPSGWVSTSVQTAELTANDGVNYDGMGVSVAISRDGSLVVAGAPVKQIGVNENQGQAYVFARPTAGWVSEHESARLLASENGTGTGFGNSAAVSGDGSVVSVGAPYEGSGDGAAYVFQTGVASVWVPVVSHTNGVNGSRWRSEVGVLNPGAVAADVEARLHTTGGVLSSRTIVAPGQQAMLDDVAGRLGFTGSGALEVASDQGVVVTSRTYTASGIGTVGQSYGSYRPGEGLAAGQSAWLLQLAENAAFRTNISLTNTGTVSASAAVELHDGAGTPLASYAVDLAAGEWKQENRPFLTKAGQTGMNQGYAKVTVTSGYGVIACASVVDNVTNDPTEIETPLGTSPLERNGWVPVASHSVGVNGSQWRSDLALLNIDRYDGEVTVQLYTAEPLLLGPYHVPAGGQVVLTDVVGLAGFTGSAALEVRFSGAQVLLASRTYTGSGEGTVGQSYASYGSYGPRSGLAAGQSAWLPQLTENAAYRTNISLTNGYLFPASALVELYDGSSTLLTSYSVDLAPGEWKQENRPFFTKGGQTAMDRGYAKVTATFGGGVVATASVVDNVTNDPRTVSMVR